MFWILRRTQLASAANFFNSINNNGGSSSNNNNSNNTNDRKGYNKLSGSDEPDVSYCTDNGGGGGGGGGKCCGLAHGDTNSNSSNMASSGSMKTGLVATARDTSDSESNFTDFEVSDDSDYDEALTCNVCDRSFATMRHLGRHQQKKRHFGCSACDSLFPSLMALEHHKEEFEHWSGDESCDDASQSGDDTSQDTVTSEELERLL